MSIHDEIEWRKREGRLLVFSPRLQATHVRRVILMRPEVNEALDQPRRSRAEIERWAALEADMSWFVEGGYVNRDFMKRLANVEEVWTLRSVRPRPSLRLFGRFAEPDVFVATHVAERAQLGAKHSDQFRIEIRRCKSAWTQMFTSPPFSGNHEYITENAEERASI